MYKYILTYIIAATILHFNLGCTDYFTEYSELTVKVTDSLLTNEVIVNTIDKIKSRLELSGIEKLSIEEKEKGYFAIKYLVNSDFDYVPQLVSTKGSLEFRLLPKTDYALKLLAKIDSIVAANLVSDLSISNSITYQDNSNELDVYQQIEENKKKEEEKFEKEHPFFSVALIDPKGRSADIYVEALNKDKLNSLLNQPEVKEIIDEEFEFKYSTTTFSDDYNRQYYILYLVNKKQELSGYNITDATASMDWISDVPIINMTLNDEGASEMLKVTEKNINSRLAILIDGKVYSAPVIKSKIPGGRVQIEGMPKIEEAENLAIILKTGALPSSVQIIEAEN
jgi:preprotein translocase subunit SecD